MRYYPLFYDLRDAACLIVGAGRVGRRKASTLLGYPVRQLRIVDPSPELSSLWPEDPRVVRLERAFRLEDLDGMDLVFAATDNIGLNAEIARECGDKKILCNSATEDAGSFIAPAVLQSGPIQIAVSTQGASPALSGFLKRELAAWLRGGYGDLAVLLGELRPLVMNLGLPQAENARLFNLLCEKNNIAALLEALRTQSAKDLQLALQKLLPAEFRQELPALSVKVINKLAQNHAQ